MLALDALKPFNEKKREARRVVLQGDLARKPKVYPFIEAGYRTPQQIRWIEKKKLMANKPRLVFYREPRTMLGTSQPPHNFAGTTGECVAVSKDILPLTTSKAPMSVKPSPLKLNIKDKLLAGLNKKINIGQYKIPVWSILLGIYFIKK